MSRSVWILLLLLALWILLGLWLWPKFLGGNSDESKNQPCVVSWELKDGSTVIAKSDATINFGKSSATMKKLDAELTKSIDQVAKYLSGNKAKNMTVIGYYDKDESPGTGTLRELALARANAAKAMLTKKGVSPNQLAVLPMMYDEENHENSDCLSNNSLNRGASFSMGKLKGSE